MRTWRQTTYYGFWVIGLTCRMAVVFDGSLEPFATRVKHYWFWEIRVNVPGWYSAPWVNFLAWFAGALFFFNYTAPSHIYTLPLHDPLPIPRLEPPTRGYQIGRVEKSLPSP